MDQHVLRAPYRGPWMIETVPARAEWSTRLARADRASTRSSCGAATSSSDDRASVHAADRPAPRPRVARRDARAGRRDHRLRRVPRQNRQQRSPTGRLLGIGIGLYIEPQHRDGPDGHRARGHPRAARAAGRRRTSGRGRTARASRRRWRRSSPSSSASTFDDVDGHAGRHAATRRTARHRREPQRPHRSAPRSNAPRRTSARRSQPDRRALLEAAPEDLEIVDWRDRRARHADTRDHRRRGRAHRVPRRSARCPPGMEPGLEAEAATRPTAVHRGRTRATCARVEVDPVTGAVASSCATS